MKIINSFSKAEVLAEIDRPTKCAQSLLWLLIKRRSRVMLRDVVCCQKELRPHISEH